MKVRFTTLVLCTLAFAVSCLAAYPTLAVEQVGAGQVGTGQVGTGQVGTGQVRTGQVRTGQVRTELEDGWISLFNGKDLSGWKANEDETCFQVEDGRIIVNGNRSHLFYVGPVNDGKFKNFEWKCEIQTKPNSNSGMYFHTEFQDEGWPSKGYEVQVNNTHRDPRKTGGLYAIADVMEKSPAQDGEWFTQHVIVKGKKVVIKVNDKVTVDYTEPDHPSRPENMKDRLLSQGTIALQGHDPGSEVHFRKIMIKPLP